MSESNPTNETDDSITHDGSIPGNLPDPVMSPNNCVTTSYGQAGTSTLVSQPFSPTAPEFVSGATAHPSRAPGDSAKQDQVSKSVSTSPRFKTHSTHPFPCPAFLYSTHTKLSEIRISLTKRDFPHISTAGSQNCSVSILTPCILT